MTHPKEIQSFCLDGGAGKVSLEDVRFHFGSLGMTWEQAKNALQDPVNVKFEEFSLDDFLKLLEKAASLFNEDVATGLADCQVLRDLLSKFALSGQIWLDGGAGKVSLEDVQFHFGSLGVTWGQAKDALQDPVKVKFEEFSLDDLLKLLGKAASLYNENGATGPAECQVLKDLLSKFALSGQICLDGAAGRVSLKDVEFPFGSLGVTWEQAKKALQEPVKVKFEEFSLDDLLKLLEKAASLFAFQRRCRNWACRLSGLEEFALQVCPERPDLPGQWCWQGEPGRRAVPFWKPGSDLGASQKGTAGARECEVRRVLAG